MLLVGNGQGLHISHIGYVCFQTSCSAVLHLRDTLCVPKLTKNLISVSKLLEDNTDITIEFVANMCFIKDKRNEQHLAQGIAKKRLYLLLSKNDFVSNSSCLTYTPSSDTKLRYQKNVFGIWENEKKNNRDFRVREKTKSWINWYD